MMQNVSGVFPHLAQIGDFGPPRSELGVGSLMPWNGKLYVQNYNSHKAAVRCRGQPAPDRRPTCRWRSSPETLGVDGTYTNRFVHFPTSQLVLGPHVIYADHKIVTIPELQPLRVCGTSRHLTKPDTHVYVLAMEGELLELDLTTYECTQLFDLNDELGTDGEMKVHYKDCYTSPSAGSSSAPTSTPSPSGPANGRGAGWRSTTVSRGR